MKKAANGVKKTVILLVGGCIVLLGIILIPLPGPGVLVTLAGLFVLSLEFDWAKQPLDKARAEWDKINQAAKERAKKVETWGDKKSEAKD